MLVIGHQEQPIDDLGVSRQVPVGIGNRRRDRDHPSVRGEAAVRFVEESQVITLAAARQLLEIEEDAGSVVLRQKRRETIEQGGPLAGIVQQRGNTGRIPLSVQRILDHRHDGRAMPRLVEDRATCRIRKDRQVMIGAGDRNPARNDPVERVDMALQRRGTGRVPGRVKGDRQGTITDRQRPGRLFETQQRAGVAHQIAPGPPQHAAMRRLQLVKRRIFGMDRQ